MVEVIAGRYEIIELIGRGGMGTVYKARQRTLDRVVAVKMLSEELAGDIEFRARFQQEAAVLARLNHPAIVQVFDIEPHGDTFCIIMEYVQGETLQSMVTRLGALPEAKVLHIGAQVARGLGYAHRLGVVHRDVKPDNILISEAGQARIMDFGIAHVKGSSLKTQTGISMGTPRYMSPEQVTGRGVDGQADLYCLGLCLYFAMTGQPPFDGENPVEIATKQVYEHPACPSSIYTAISPAADDAVMRSINKRKEERWPDGDAMADGLESVLRQREGFSRHSGLPAARESDMTGQTPSRVILADFDGSTVPDGDTGRVATLATKDAPGEPGARGGEVGQTPTVRGSGETGISGLVPLIPVPASVADFDAPPRGATPSGGVRTGFGVAAGPGNNGSGPLEAQKDATGAIEVVGGGLRAPALFWGGILLASVVAIVIFAALSQTPTQPAEIRTPAARILPSDEELHRLERATLQGLANGARLELIRAWSEFLERRERANPLDPAIGVAEEYVRWVRAQIDPLMAADDVVRRRLDRAEAMLNARRPAVAAAYTDKTGDLFGRSSSMNERVDNLRRLIERSSGSVEPGQAAALLERARRIEQEATDLKPRPMLHEEDKRAESFLLDAVQSEPSNFNAWLETGRFYAGRGYVDDARVFFLMASDKAQSGAERGLATQELESLPTE